MMGYLDWCGSARGCGVPMGRLELAEGQLTHWIKSSGPRRDER